jgi:lipoprotein-anchoring transpeptidase ErfK/SrfK
MKPLLSLGIGCFAFYVVGAEEPIPLVSPSSDQPVIRALSPPSPNVSPDSPAGETVISAPRAGVVNEREAIAQLQIFLDQKHFGPGKIDGRWGEFTGKALSYYEKVNGLPMTSVITSWAEVGKHLPMEDVYPIYTTYTISSEDLKQIGSIPRAHAEQAKKKVMPYTSLLEFLGERFHSDPDFLRELNPGMNLDDLKEGDTVRVPNVKPFKIEEVKEIAKLPERPELKNREVRIDTRTKILRLMENGKILATFPITPGSGSLPAPPGTWKIVGITLLPWFRRDESMLKHGVRSEEFYLIPAGPNNPVGVLWAGLSKSGIGIHGTNSPNTIGRSASHGCIRLANWDAIRFAEMITKGMTVKIDQPDEDADTGTITSSVIVPVSPSASPSPASPTPRPAAPAPPPAARTPLPAALAPPPVPLAPPPGSP